MDGAFLLARMFFISLTDNSAFDMTLFWVVVAELVGNLGATRLSSLGRV
jgi:hypothetical protein